jgi:hypothetical protein
MIDPQQVIDESRPMLEWFLAQSGIYQPGRPIADARLLERFSDWIDAQAIEEDDFAYLVSRVGAFICEYLIEGHGAERYVSDQRILLRRPIDSSGGAYQEFDPYATAASLLRVRQGLKTFLNAFCA